MKVFVPLAGGLYFLSSCWWMMLIIWELPFTRCWRWHLCFFGNSRRFNWPITEAFASKPVETEHKNGQLFSSCSSSATLALSVAEEVEVEFCSDLLHFRYFIIPRSTSWNSTFYRPETESFDAIRVRIPPPLIPCTSPALTG